uniref:G-protein coupled receptors family 2 profile 2 domain-containing protein n=1 Tax=Kryptolebias marmoratus TaxID=37003 RepID=A0A3Q3AWD7_KRYMA
KIYKLVLHMVALILCFFPTGEYLCVFVQKNNSYLPNDDNSTEINSIVVAATTDGKQRSNTEVNIKFGLLKARPRNVKITCVYRDKNKWSSEGCQWGGPDNEDSFLWLEQVTYVGLGISIVSLFIGLLIELVVWSDVVKTNTLYLRHTAHVNISLCLLVGNACFLASSETKSITEAWCRTSAVLKHFCYLAMFFWMLCLSTTLLHQTVFLFHKVSKKSYLRFSLALGYGCPVIVVFVTFLSYGAGSEGVYYSKDTCWLVYSGLFKGSIYTFVIPVATIVFINVFSMLVVIMKLLSHNQNADMSQEKEKAAAKTVLRSVILLTPIFGVTWVFGLATMIIDLTSGIQADVVNYIFVKQMSANLNELKQRWKGEWAKNLPQSRERLITSYRKPLLRVIAAKGFYQLLDQRLESAFHTLLLISVVSV